jgi:hypothetical protein
MKKPKVYLTNKDLLREIHLSKLTYCSKAAEQNKQYDVIVQNLSEVTLEAAETARILRLERLNADIIADNKLNELDNQLLDLSDIMIADVVFRVMSAEHLPEDPTGKNKMNPGFLRVNFPPFSHFIIENGQPKEVLRSHWKGTLEEGFFSVEHGKYSNNLSRMFLLLAKRYGSKASFCGYSYLEEMQGSAIAQLVQNGLLFDESKSSNPFAFYTTLMKRCFIRQIEIEKKIQATRDDLLIANGVNPSMTRQINDEWDTKNDFDDLGVSVGKGNVSKTKKREIMPKMEVI